MFIASLSSLSSICTVFAPRISAPKQEKFVVCIHLDNESDRKEKLMYNYVTVQ